ADHLTAVPRTEPGAFHRHLGLPGPVPAPAGRALPGWGAGPESPRAALWRAWPPSAGPCHGVLRHCRRYAAPPWRGHGGAALLAYRLEREPVELRRKVNQLFWMADQRFYAQALDRDKRQVRSISSNAGHLLWSRLPDGRRAGHLARRLATEDMFSGWGIRTLSSRAPGYNPMSYHNGSVWPHDNSIIAEGLRR